MKRRSFLGMLPTLLLAPAALCSPPNPNFTGTWKLSNERSIPARKGDITLRIDHRGPDLIVETTAQRNSGPPRHAVQRYAIDGKTSVSIGADGDEFRTSISWSGPSLVFSIEEHEDGRILRSKEIWTLIENGAALRRDRESLDSSADRTRKQTLIYLRQPSETAGR
jgi:hypothetical protein